MSEAAPQPQTRVRYRYRNRGCGFGCSSFFFVLIVGIILAIFNVGVSIGLSFRVPLTQSNLTFAGSVGEKEKAVAALPDYVEGRVGGNQNLFNNSTTMTIGPAEGIGMIVLGHQAGAPPFDLHLVVK
jgi:hypothetical protein